MLERDLQDHVLDLARILHWRVAHFRAARTAHGWRTPVSADGAGFPDLVLVRGRRLVVAELKRSAKARPTPNQLDWLAAFRGAGVEVFVWTGDDDIESIAEVLR